MSVRQFCRQQLGDLFGFLLIPLAAAPMPTWVGHRLIWRTARWRWLLPDREALAATAVAIAFPPERHDEILQESRWIFMSEMTDVFRLMLGRSPRLNVAGQWPEQGSFVAGCMHFGSGMLGMWHLKKMGRDPRLVYRPVVGRTLRGRPIARLVFGLRMRVVNRLCSGRAIPTGGAFRAMIDALESSQSAVVAAVDTPAARDQSSHIVSLGHASLPVRTGLLQVVKETSRPLAPFAVWIDRETGQRTLDIGQCMRADDNADVIHAYVSRIFWEYPGQLHVWHALTEYLYQGQQAGARAPEGSAGQGAG